jgi:hypothetical protein
MTDGVGLVSIPHPEGLAELAAEIICLRAENEKLDDIRIDYICKINKLVDERENLKKENDKLKDPYNRAIDDAADLLNCVDLPRDELAAAVRKLKK